MVNDMTTPELIASLQTRWEAVSNCPLIGIPSEMIPRLLSALRREVEAVKLIERMRDHLKLEPGLGILKADIDAFLKENEQ